MCNKTLFFLLLLRISIINFSSAIDLSALTPLLTDEVPIAPASLSFQPSISTAGGKASYLFSFSTQTPLDPSQRYTLLLTFRAVDPPSTYKFLEKSPFPLCWLLPSSFQTTRNSSSSLYNDFIKRTSIQCFNVNQTQSLLIYLPQALNTTSLTIQIDKLLNPTRYDYSNPTAIIF